MASVISFLPSCATVVPEPSDSEINAMAEKSYQEVLSKTPRSQNQAWAQMVERVAQRIAAASGENFKWQTVLLESKEVNAWCMPGGKMAVYTGIMPVLKTEGALAAVMGHEVAHATLRHGKKRYARAIQDQALGAIVAAASQVGGQMFCETQSCRQMAAIGGAAAGFGIMFFQRKFSREDETEADRAGQIYMARAGYDPAESIRLWERMSAASGGKAPPEFISTHPSDTRRRSNLQAWMPEAQAEYAKSSAKYGIGVPITR